MSSQRHSPKFMNEAVRQLSRGRCRCSTTRATPRSGTDSREASQSVTIPLAIALNAHKTPDLSRRSVAASVSSPFKDKLDEFTALLSSDRP